MSIWSYKIYHIDVSQRCVKREQKQEKVVLESMWVNIARAIEIQVEIKFDWMQHEQERSIKIS